MTDSSASVVIDVKSAAAALKSYQRKKIPAAAKRAVNTALRGGRTIAKKALKKRISMTVGKIGERIKLDFAKNRAIGTLRVVGPRKGKEFSNLGSFKIKIPRKAARGKRRLGPSGVKARVWADSTAKAYKNTFAWKRPGKSGDAITVFRRVRGAAKVAPSKRAGVNQDGSTGIRRIKRGPRSGKAILRQPIAPVYGASLKREFTRANRRGKRPTIDVVRKLMRARFIKEFDRLLART